MSPPPPGPGDPLREEDLCADPIAQFSAWFEQAGGCGLIEPTAMTLATAAPDGRPSARVVLLKHFDDDGFVFFTNFDSRKGREITANPHAAAVLWWPPLHRQVRIEGTLTRVSEAQSDAYFRRRPRGSQLGAWISQQSSVISRADLERAYHDIEQRHADHEVPRPPFWGGFRLLPLQLEFWQHRENRLHDRLRYRRDGTGGWILQRLAP